MEFSAPDLVTSRSVPPADQPPPRPTARRRTPIGAEPDPDWRDSAACVGVDLNLFFPISTVGRQAEAQIEEAKAVCSECAVQRDCLAWALAVGPEFGIFGGCTDAERRRLRQRLN